MHIFHGSNGIAKFFRRNKIYKRVAHKLMKKYSINEKFTKITPVTQVSRYLVFDNSLESYNLLVIRFFAALCFILVCFEYMKTEQNR